MNWRGLQLDRKGATALEFALVAIPFLYVLIATTDLGRYFLTQHSLRTLTAEAVRSVMVNCSNAAGACSLNSTQISAVEVKTPFLTPASTVLNASQAAPTGTGLRTVTVTATYPFSFIFVPWTGHNGSLAETTTFSY